MKLRDQYLYYVEHPDDLIDDARIAATVDRDQMSEELSKQTGLFLNWAHLASLARYELAKAERFMKDQVIPDLRDAARATIKAQGLKETVDAVDDRMKLAPLYQTHWKHVEDLKFVSDILEDTADAIWERKGCLQSANSRAGREMQQYSV